MAFLSSFQPTLIHSPSPSITRPATNPFLRNRTQFGSFSHHRPFPRGTLYVSQFEFGQLPDPETSQVLIKDLFGKAEGFLYTIVDAAVAASPSSTDYVTTSSKTSDWFSGISNYMEIVLKVLKDGLSTVHAPCSYGFAIILLTVLVKAASFPLTKKHVCLFPCRVLSYSFWVSLFGRHVTSNLFPTLSHISFC